MINPLLTDFTAGELSPKLSGRSDIAIFRKGCELLQNSQPMTQGGTKRRPGTQYVGDLPAAVRLIPFTIDSTHAFIVEFSNLQLRIWQDDELVEFSVGVTTASSPYTTSQLDDIHFTQSYDRIFFTHQSHVIRELIYSVDSFTWQPLVISTTRDGHTAPFGSTGNYPKTCAIISGRLWLASSATEPATVWASRPYGTYGYGDFTDYDVETTTVTDYKDPDDWADASVPEYEEVTESQDVVIPSHAIKITLGSDKNEEVMWVSGQQEIIIGTLTGEYVLPGNIDALNQSAQLRSRFGSAPQQGKVVGSAVLFIQSDRKKLREYYYQEQTGYQSPDLTWAADHILQAQAKSFDFQRTPDPRVFCTLDDGTLKVLSYSRMYNLVGWARWVISGTVKQVCVLDTPDEQVVYLSVLREGTVRLEKFYEPYTDVYHLDCASVVTSSAEAAITYPFASDDWVIMDSTGELVTTPEADTEYTIGFLYTTDILLNRLTTGGPYGTGQTRKKRATEIRARVVNSYAFTAGYKDRLYTCATPASGYPYTGDVRVPLSGEYDADMNIQIKIETHRPLMITAIVPDVEVF